MGSDDRILRNCSSEDDEQLAVKNAQHKIFLLQKLQYYHGATQISSAVRAGRAVRLSSCRLRSRRLVVKHRRSVPFQLVLSFPSFAILYHRTVVVGK